MIFPSLLLANIVVAIIMQCVTVGFKQHSATIVAIQDTFHQYVMQSRSKGKKSQEKST